MKNSQRILCGLGNAAKGGSWVSRIQSRRLVWAFLTSPEGRFLKA